jgi:hypothetical protein
MAIDPLLSLLVGAFGAAALTVGGGLAGAYIQSKREHARWIREQRLGAYAAYARASERILSLRGSDTPEGREYLEQAHAATATLRLLGPEHVFDAAFAFTVSAIRYAILKGEPDANSGAIDPAYTELSVARQIFIEAARQELLITG